jgi:hypothetical protein
MLEPGPFCPPMSMICKRKRVRAVLALAASALLAALWLEACGPTHRSVPGPRATRISGRLHTSGTSILDAEGHPIRLLGVNASGMEVGAGQPQSAVPVPPGCLVAGGLGWLAPNRAEYDDIAAWGFNSVRVPISWANLEPTPPVMEPDGNLHHSYNQDYLSALDEIVHQFALRGVAVILDMHQQQWSPAFTNIPTRRGGVQCQGAGMPAWLYPNAATEPIAQAKLEFFSNDRDVQAGLVQAWENVAARYAGNSTVVGADMLNEPFTGGAFPPADLQLGAFYARVGAAIRSANPQLLLIFEEGFDIRAGAFALDSPPPFANEVYSFHLYQPNWDPDGLRLIGAFSERALTWGVPLWIGEFDAFGRASNGHEDPNWQSDTRQMLAYCSTGGIGWAVWNYRGMLAPATGTLKPDLLPVLQQGFVPETQS